MCHSIMAPRIAKNAHFYILWLIYMKNWWLFFPLVQLNFLSDCFLNLFDIYIDMGERIAGKQDMPRMIKN